MKRKNLYALLTATLLVGFIFCGFTISSQKHKANGGIGAGIFQSDAIGYYDFLRYTFLFDDISKQSYAEELPNGNKLNKYTYGVALLQFPFFIVSHLFSSNTEVTGFEDIYGYGILTATLFYLFFGLLMIFLLLKEWFDLKTSFTSVIILLLGTNIYHYAFHEPGLSHIYSFFCFSGFVYFSNSFFNSGKKLNDLIFCSVFLGIAVLIRPTNLFLVLFFLLFDVYSWNDLKNRIFLIIKDFRIPVSFLFFGFLLFFPQLLYWKNVTDHWIIYSYGEEKFIYWKNPQIFEIFFGISNGWLVYTPLMGLSVIGMPFLFIKKQFHSWGVITIFIAISYTCASWWAYNFGCAFGYRSFIEYYPVFIIPLAYLLNKIFNSKKIFFQSFIISFIVIGLYVNLRTNRSFSTFPWCYTEIWKWEDYLAKLASFF